MTWLYFINWFILQWFFIRLVRICEDGATVGFAIIAGVVPTTGWNNCYKYFPFDKARYIKLYGRLN